MQNSLSDLHSHFRSDSPQSLYAYRVGGTEALPERPYSTGIHPWDLPQHLTEEWFGSMLHNLEESITSHTAAIGEIGLDYHTATTPAQRSNQQHLFTAQLAIAQRLHLPVILHCVRAYNDLLPLLHGFSERAVIHGFTGSARLAEQLLSAGLALSFGWGLLRSPKTQQALILTPAERLFLESDNDPRPLETLYETVAELRHTSSLSLQKQITQNYKTLFEPCLTF